MRTIIHAPDVACVGIGKRYGSPMSKPRKSIIQTSSQPVDIASWIREDETYPEGKRVKTLVYCPDEPPFLFLESGHRYLFKRSSHWGLEQFWVEIFAYQLGLQMEIDVPPTFAAFDSKQNECGALIRWYLEKISQTQEEEAIAGGDLCVANLQNFDRKTGEQHNLALIAHIFEKYLPSKYPNFNADWKSYWAKTFIFDALIGNTDRHQDNWAIIRSISSSIGVSLRISPVFDNGTSMGYEVPSKKFESKLNNIRQYVLNGKHHMRLNEDSERIEHVSFLKKFIELYPETRNIMMECLTKVDSFFFKELLEKLTGFSVPVRLSHDRADFMLKLIEFRHKRLVQELGT